MTLASRYDLSKVVLTEMVQGGALAWLDNNVRRNREAGLQLADLSTAALDWSWIDEPPPECATVLDAQWDLVLGSDLVYNEVGVQMLCAPPEIEPPAFLAPEPLSAPLPLPQAAAAASARAPRKPHTVRAHVQPVRAS